MGNDDDDDPFTLRTTTQLYRRHTARFRVYCARVFTGADRPTFVKLNPLLEGSTGLYPMGTSPG